MNITKIEWTDMSWNPVTGCNHACPYCYAREITRRFGGKGDCFVRDYGSNGLHEIDVPTVIKSRSNLKDKYFPYPFFFEPTFHRYRLEEPQRIKKPQNIFVGSMADLFGEWVLEEWILEVFEACKKAPQHRYLFLTKNPKRYEDLIKKRILPSILNPYYFGITITTQEDSKKYFDWRFNSHNDYKDNYWINRFMSVEPLQEKIELYLRWFGAEWVIIGAETGNHKDKIAPKREWIEDIVHQCHAEKGHQYVPVFMKSSLAKIWGGPLIQEYPWKGEKS